MGGNTVPRFRIKIPMGWSDTGFFSETYRVVAVEAERLTIKGIITGTVLTIINSDPATPLTAEQYPLGKLSAQRSFGFCAKLICRFPCLAY